MAKKATNFKDDTEKTLGVLKKLHWEDVVEIYNIAK